MSLGYQNSLGPENCMYKFDEISTFLLSVTAKKLCISNNNVYILSILTFWAILPILYTADVTHT